MYDLSLFWLILFTKDQFVTTAHSVLFSPSQNFMGLAPSVRPFSTLL